MKITVRTCSLHPLGKKTENNVHDVHDVHASPLQIAFEDFPSEHRERREHHSTSFTPPLLEETLAGDDVHSVAISNIVKVKTVMDRLKAVGCRFALDNFGSGMSSFGYLKSLPVEFLKIDGLFVKNITTDSVDRIMVHSINEVGHALGIQTIAEFVENEAILEVWDPSESILLKALGLPNRSHWTSLN